MKIWGTIAAGHRGGTSGRTHVISSPTIVTTFGSSCSAWLDEPAVEIRPSGFEPLAFGSGDQRSIRAELRAHILDSSSYGWVCSGKTSVAVEVAIIGFTAHSRGSAMRQAGLLVSTSRGLVGKTAEDRRHYRDRRSER